MASRVVVEVRELALAALRAHAVLVDAEFLVERHAVVVVDPAERPAFGERLVVGRGGAERVGRRQRRPQHGERHQRRQHLYDNVNNDVGTISLLYTCKTPVHLYTCTTTPTSYGIGMSCGTYGNDTMAPGGPQMSEDPTNAVEGPPHPKYVIFIYKLSPYGYSVSRTQTRLDLNKTPVEDPFRAVWPVYFNSSPVQT